MPSVAEAWIAYKLRWKRRRLLWRSIRARRDLTPVATRLQTADPAGVLAFACVRNEKVRLPWFLDHHRRLGVAHFLVVDNGSDDGTTEMLAAEPDVSVWKADGSYRESRFGMDWVGWLLLRYGHGRWCLTIDADEALVYPHCDKRPLSDLVAWLDRSAQIALPALLLDMYAEGPIGTQPYVTGTDPFATLAWFDATGYRRQRQVPLNVTRVQGGVRERVFFPTDPSRSPTLSKLPLVRWNRRFAYVNSTHSALPRRLNGVADREGAVTGVILHSKFLDIAIPKAREDLQRRAHFHDPDRFRDYYEDLIAGPTLWHERSERFLGPGQLETLGLMSRGRWD